MNTKRLQKFLAPAVALLSFTATVFAYARILEIERPNFTLFEDYLRLGQNNFYILSGDNCIGEVIVRARKDRATFVNVDGTLRAQYKDNPIVTTIRSEFYFNPIGQLSEGSLNIKTLNLELAAISKDIHPIKAAVVIKGLSEDKTINFDIDGPIIINEYEPGQLRIEYSQQARLGNPIIEGPVSFLTAQHKLSITKEDPGKKCEPINQGLLSLDSIIKTLERFSVNDFVNRG